MMIVDNQYEIGDFVYVRTDPAQKRHIVTSLLVRTGGTISYELSCGPETKWFYEIELSYEKDYVILHNQ